MNAKRAVFGGSAERKRNKYNVAPKWQRTFEGIVYDSKAECDRARELRILLKAGEIRQIVEQKRFELGVPENVYIADFMVTDREGRVWVEDVKGKETAKFKHDKRLWRSYGPCPLVILTRRGRSWSKEVIEPDNRESDA